MGSSGYFLGIRIVKWKAWYGSMASLLCHNMASSRSAPRVAFRSCFLLLHVRARKQASWVTRLSQVWALAARILPEACKVVAFPASGPFIDSVARCGPMQDEVFSPRTAQEK